jgi:hypothetical protein
MLLDALVHPQVRLYLHVDKRVPQEPFREAAAAAAAETQFLPPRASDWAAAGVIDVILDALRRGLADGCDYFMLISGQDFPLKPAAELVAFAEAAGSRTYMEHWPLSDSIHAFGGRNRTDFYAYTVRGRRLVCVPWGEDTRSMSVRGRAVNSALRLRSVFKGKRRFPDYARAHAGAAWWNMSRDAADYVLRFADAHPDYRRYHTYTAATDEVFFQSILAGTEYADSHELVDDAQRFYVWDGTHARTLVAADLPAMIESGKLFARKFDIDVDAEVIAQLADRVAR